MIRNLRLGAIARIIAALGGLYLLAAASGLLIPANAGWRAPADGVRIYIEDNGIHTGIVMPAVAEGVDWGGIVGPEHLRDPRYAAHRWRGFGWGDRDFYIGTPTWADLNPLTVIKGALGLGSSVMHVDAIPEPRVGRSVRAITLRPEEYRRLAAFVQASFADGPPRHGYAGYDIFYPAHGRYSAIHTCNAWTGAALRAAGVRMGWWTPFPATVMGWLS